MPRPGPWATASACARRFPRSHCHGEGLKTGFPEPYCLDLRRFAILSSRTIVGRLPMAAARPCRSLGRGQLLVRALGVFRAPIVMAKACRLAFLNPTASIPGHTHPPCAAPDRDAGGRLGRFRFRRPHRTRRWLRSGCFRTGIETGARFARFTTNRGRKTAMCCRIICTGRPTIYTLS